MLDFQNSQGQNLPSLRGKFPSNPAYMHPRDLEALGVRDGDLVEIDSGYGRTNTVVMGSTDIRAGVVALPHGWGVASENERDVRTQGAAVARLIPDAALFDRLTGMPLMSALPVNVRAAAA